MGDIGKLNSFINLLNEKLDFSFSTNNFNDRLKLQKYVFIAKYFGFNHAYNYNLYIRGPYSSDLADDYYNLLNTENNIVLLEMKMIISN
ncbi:MAG: hypothetical protein LBD03_07810 [Methanobrevibacter sp.]|jgi:uncharacterized protein YwgA|nr:hypothetical protein [Candidatus Methanovirga procula]